MTDGATLRVVLDRVLPGTPAEVFAAWTDAETLRTFMCPGDSTAERIELDARAGGRFRIVMRESGRDLDHRGEYLVFEPGQRLVFTWASDATGRRDTLVTIELTPHEDGTRLVLVHEGLPDDVLGRRHEWGWTSVLEKLGRRPSDGSRPPADGARGEPHGRTAGRSSR
jgi:uncharacterized protein YndB with AHSA1/START domain